MKRSLKKKADVFLSEPGNPEAEAYRGLLDFLNRPVIKARLIAGPPGKPLPTSKADAIWASKLRGIAFVANGLTWVRVRDLLVPVRAIGAGDLAFWGVDGARLGTPVLATEAPPLDARPREDIKEKIRKLLKWLKGLGLDTAALEGYLADIEFHETGRDTEVDPKDGDAEAVTFFPKLGPFAIIPWDSGVVLVFDGNIHVVFKQATVRALLAEEFDRECHLTSAADTVLHELIHVLLSRTACGVDDDEDSNVTTLERAVNAWIHWRKVVKSNGKESGEARRARRWVDFWIGEARTGGVGGCLGLLGVS